MFEVGPNGVLLALAIVPMLFIGLLGPILAGHLVARRALGRWMDRQSQGGWASARGREIGITSTQADR